MDNLNLLCQAIRFQRTALQNSLAMISAVQQHGEKFLKTTLEQSPWIPGEGRDVCLFWAGLWTRNLSGVTALVDGNLAIWEGFAHKGTFSSRPAAQPAAGPVLPPQPAAAAAEATPDEEPAAAVEAAEEPPQPAAAAIEATPDEEPAAAAETAEEPPQSAAAAAEATPDEEPAAAAQAAEKAPAPPEEPEQTAMVKIDAQRALVSGQIPEIRPKRPQGKPAEKKKARNKSLKDQQKIAKEL